MSQSTSNPKLTIGLLLWIRQLEFELVLELELELEQELEFELP